MKKYALMENDKIIAIVQATNVPPGYVEITDELEKLLIPTFVTITIPLAVFQASPELQQKLSEMTLIFSEIKRRPDANGNLVLSNINLDDVSSFLTAEEYTNLKAVGVVFDEKIDALFVT